MILKTWQSFRKQESFKQAFPPSRLGHLQASLDGSRLGVGSKKIYDITEKEKFSRDYRFVAQIHASAG